MAIALPVRIYASKLLPLVSTGHLLVQVPPVPLGQWVQAPAGSLAGTSGAARSDPLYINPTAKEERSNDHNVSIDHFPHTPHTHS